MRGIVSVIDHERRLLLIHIARTGGTSIEAALAGNDWWFIDSTTKHMSASQTKQLYGDQIWQDYIKFTVIRNPWDRVISMWSTGWWHEQARSFSTNQLESLKDFILKLKPHPNEKYNSLFYYEIIDEKIDFILRFETLQSDFSEMLKKVGASDIVLPHKEKRDRKNYREYYDLEAQEMVNQLFQKDIELYGYEY